MQARQRRHGRRLVVAVALAAALVMAMPEAGWARPAGTVKRGPTPPSAAGDRQPGTLLVGFGASVDDQQKSDVESRNNASVQKRLSAINVDVVSLPPGKDQAVAIQEFQQDSAVAFAEPNFVARADALATPNDSLYSQQYGPQKLKAYEAHGVVYPAGYPAFSGGNPTGVTHPLVAVIDTGIAGGAGVSAASSDLVHKVAVKAADCTLTSQTATKACPTSAPFDDYGHGTHVAGITAAETNNALGMVGIAPGAELVSIKSLDSQGSGYYSWIASGILCAANLSSCGLGTGHADVINMSLGGSSGSSTLQSAIQTARSAGVVVVASAGNSNTKSLSYPGAYADLSVIATDSSDGRASFSNFGGYANQVSAPGLDIVSTVSKDLSLAISDSSGFASLSGTSMASPHVAGVAALLAGQGLAAPDIVTRIKSTADVLPSTGPADTLHFGAGRVNAYRAVTAAPPTPDFTLSMAPASATVAPGGGTSYTVTISRTGGFTGSVALSATGLPAGTTASAPSTTGTTSTLAVSTSSTTPTGSSAFTVTGTSAALTRTTTATLVVSTAPAADFSLSISPASRSVARGGKTTYTVTITRSGAAGSVAFSVTGLPAGASASAPATTGNSATLTVTTSSTTPAGTFPFTVRGTSGALTRTTSATLVVTGGSPPPCNGQC